jgi:EF-hand domain-containing protein 1
MSNPVTNLPMLPGYNFDTEPRTNFAKKQMFAVIDGTPVTDRQRLPAGTPTPKDSSLDLCMGDSKGSGLDAKQQQKLASKTGPNTNLVTKPKYVFKFFAYFIEEIKYDPTESQRVRKVTISYFTEDKTIQINEPKTDNSGLVQGRILRRARAPKADGTPVDLDDLQVGNTVTIHGFKYTIVNCSDQAREAAEAAGKPQPDAIEYPIDTYSQMQAAKKRTEFRIMRNPESNFVEASMGAGSVNVRATKQFLAHDGEVLRFTATLVGDNADSDDQRNFTVQVFLADSTVQVTERMAPNSGRAGLNAFLKRSKLPKDFRASVASVSSIGHQAKEDYYTELDFMIGTVINVYSHTLLLTDADAFTKNFYKERGATDESLQGIDMSVAPAEVKKNPIPPYNGYGSEEDSLQSFYNLVPKPPRKNMAKLLAYDGKALRFLAKFSNPSIDDKERRFVINFDLARDKVSVFEKVVRNSGFVGGKFMEPLKLKNPATGAYFEPQQFFIGAKLIINSYHYTLVDADEYTLRIMDEEPQVYLRSNVAAVNEHLAAIGASAKVEEFQAAFQTIDADGTGKVTKADFCNVFEQLGLTESLDKHEIVTLARKYDTAKDGNVSVSDFIASLTV